MSAHYFGTVAMVRSSANTEQFVRDLSQPWGSSGGQWSFKPDTVLGLQLNSLIAPGVEAATQVVSRYRYDATWRPEVMWAYLSLGGDAATHVRVGRLGADFYMLSDSRLLGYTNLAVRPEVDYYGELPIYHIDGVDISHTFPVGKGLVTAKLFAGLTNEKVPGGGLVWDLGDAPFLGANLDYRLDAWTFRLGYSQMRFRHDWTVSDDLRAAGLPANVIDALSMAGKSIRYYSLGAIYDKGPLQVQLMGNHVSEESCGYQNYYSGYVLAGYRIGEFTPYAGLSRSFSKPNSFDTSTLPAPVVRAVSTVTALTHSDQTTYTLGVRWDFRRNMDVKLQWDGIRGRSSSIFLYPQDRPGWSGDTDVFSMALDFAL